MASAALDDLIKNNKKSGNNSGGGRGRGRGAARRLPNRGSNRAAPYATTKAPESAASQHDMFGGDQAVGFAGQGGGRASSIETGTKLRSISNLDYAVSNYDIKADCETAIEYAIHSGGKEALRKRLYLQPLSPEEETKFIDFSCDAFDFRLFIP